MDNDDHSVTKAAVCAITMPINRPALTAPKTVHPAQDDDDKGRDHRIYADMGADPPKIGAMMMPAMAVSAAPKAKT